MEVHLRGLLAHKSGSLGEIMESQKRLQGVPDKEVLEIDIIAPFDSDLIQVVYKIITKDHAGNLLQNPYIGINVSNPSGWVDVNMLMSTTAKINASWKKFSEIQCATWIEWNEESVERFILWRKSGNDDDAWT